MQTFHDFIYVEENAISSMNCRRLINFFEKNTDMHGPGQQGDHDINRELKASTDICFLPEHANNRKIRRVITPFLKALDKAVLGPYNDRYSEGLAKMEPWSLCPYFNLQRYLPREGYFNWHSESSSRASAGRKIVWMIYLNDVKDGGGTEFKYQGITTRAKEGSIVIWPGEWTHLHRGQISQTGVKYILTGWYTFYGEET